jgi:hypothetical protein
MTVLITLTIAGTDSGPFDLYSNLDGFTSAFETGVSKASLLAGYSSSLVPDYTTTIRVKSNGVCLNYVDILVESTTTTTTTTTSPIPTEGCFESVTVTFDTDITFDYTDCQSVIVTLGLLAADSPHTINRLDCIDIATLIADQPFEITAVGPECGPT